MKKNHYKNLVLQIDRYNPETLLQGCYKGSVTGKVAGGPLNGKIIKLHIQGPQYLSPTHGWEELPRFRKSPRHTLATGGYINFRSVSRVEGNDSILLARMVDNLALPGTEMRIDMPIQFAPALDKEGRTRQFKSNNATMYRAFILNSDEAITARFGGDVYNAVANAFMTNKAAILAVIKPDGKRETKFLWQGTDTVAEALNRYLVINMESQVNYRTLLRMGGRIDVIPLETMFVDPETAHEIDINGLIFNRAYKIGGICGSIQTALRTADKATREVVEKAFAAGLSKDAWASFAEFGWKETWLEDINRFLQDLAIEPPKVPTYGFALSTAAVKKINEAKVLSWSQALGPAVSLDYVSTPSDPDAPERFVTSFEKL